MYEVDLAGDELCGLNRDNWRSPKVYYGSKAAAVLGVKAVVNLKAAAMPGAALAKSYMPRPACSCLTKESESASLQ